MTKTKAMWFAVIGAGALTTAAYLTMVAPPPVVQSETPSEIGQTEGASDSESCDSCSLRYDRLKSAKD